MRRYRNDDPPEDVELPEWFKRRSQTAFKQHTCDLCKKPIFKGTRYEYTIYKMDGKLHYGHSHRYCVLGDDQL